jgi:hypothetical protein
MWVNKMKSSALTLAVSAIAPIAESGRRSLLTCIAVMDRLGSMSTSNPFLHH